MATLTRNLYRIRQLRRGVALTLVLGSIAGCGSSSNKAPEAPQKTPSLAMDPCAERLHDIAGVMLEYYAVHRTLPRELGELKALSGHPEWFICPESKDPYVYDLTGIAAPQGGEVYGRVVLYDARPVHHGVRWGVAVIEGGRNAQLVTRVVAVPGSSVTSTTRPAVVPWK